MSEGITLHDILHKYGLSPAEQHYYCACLNQGITNFLGGLGIGEPFALRMCRWHMWIGL